MPTGCDHRVATIKSPDLADDPPALCQNGRSSDLMNGSIDAAPTQQRRVRRIHDSVGRFQRDVGWPNDLDRLLLVEQQPHKKFSDRADDCLKLTAAALNRPTSAEA